MATFTRQKYRLLAKGFRGRSKNCIRIMAHRVEKALSKKFVNRKQRPRLLRQEWITRINGALYEHNTNYSRFINLLHKSNIKLDRKILANICLNEPFSFKAIVDELHIQSLESRAAEQKWDHPYRIPIEDSFAAGDIIYGKTRLIDKNEKENNQFIGFRDRTLTDEQKKKIMKM